MSDEKVKLPSSRILDKNMLQMRFKQLKKALPKKSTLFWSAFGIWIIASWITHVVVCLKTSAWGFLIADAIMFPVGIIHGTGVWFGAW